MNQWITIVVELCVAWAMAAFGARIVIVVAFCVAWAMVTFGAMQADLDDFCRNEVPSICDARMVHQNTAIAALFAINPIGWIAAIILTDGYEHDLMFRKPVPVKTPT